MGKLRLIKKRLHYTHHEFDLRGLGSDPILQDSYPQSRLAIQYEDQAKFNSLVAKYNLFAEISTFSDVVLYRLANKREGHQKECLTLFFFALETIRAFPHARTYLFEYNPLSFHLYQSLKEINENPFCIEKFLQSWLEEGTMFSVDPVSSIHLFHSGVLPNSSETRIDWTLKDLERKWKDLEEDFKSIKKKASGDSGV